MITFGRHRTGAARTEGFYKIPASEKSKYLPSRISRLKQDESGAEGDDEDQPASTSTAITSASSAKTRASRVQFRQLVAVAAAIYGENAVDVLKFNQMKARKTRLQFSKSRIHDWGLFALQPIEANDIVIEYIGEVIRQKVADHREKLYEQSGIGSSYLFRIDEDTIIDATKKGNLARFINHCCDPNCNAKIITIDGCKKIVIYANRDIEEGEEITYDYKFPIEEDKIPCFCGAEACRGYLN
ncbi:hypothetical protein DFJ73DRAFT_619421 [Zopfochytrium polystomum]|nr:hypothetical protein DFJ73DRAFT_619421 [Zopfochytrium polystomum]